MIAHVVSPADAPSSPGSTGTSGITRVCISETTIPPKASTATTTFGRTTRAARLGVPTAALVIRMAPLSSPVSITGRGSSF
ncbi:hypothetical protein GCM10023214_41990 [Amycolatopsis dongchuanensis]|uniref:Uncharacterized protein n=1 Tax=Amycolatopsis dongchuanensis TaxID=1070866 RepID=A0ABP9QU41_9PSEU